MTREKLAAARSRLSHLLCRHTQIKQWPYNVRNSAKARERNRNGKLGIDLFADTATVGPTPPFFRDSAGWILARTGGE